MKVIAVDLGGTQYRVAVGSADGTLEWKVARPTGVSRGPEAVLAELFSSVDKAFHAAGGPAAVSRIGIAAPGPLDPWSGVIFNPPNMPGWDRIPLTDLVQDRFGIPAVAGNDANVAALGEHRYGAGQGIADMVYLTVSTGIGGGVISQDRLLVGTGGFAAEPGHMTIDMNGVMCNCGNVGCLEALASGTAIARRAREAIRAGARGTLASIAPDKITARSVSEAALDGDELAAVILSEAGEALGTGVVNLAHIFNPRRMVIGGGVAINAGRTLWDAMMRVVEARTMAPILRDLQIVPAQLGDEAGLVGATALALSGY